MNQREIVIAGKVINEGQRPFIIAEAGVHHFNSVELAKAYILEAKVAGADAIKFQTYQAERIATTWAPTYWDAPTDQTQFDIFANRSQLSREAYKTLFNFANEVGIIMLSTPFDPDSAMLLAENDMAAYKIASADLTYYPLLETVASFGRPILLSTGAATYDEIRQSVAFLTEKQAQFVLLHCVLSYPTAVKDANLQRITALREQFANLIIGYSDHTQPQDTMLACPLAVALGARVIEKHFTLNKLLKGDDHYHAVGCEGLARLVRDCHDAILMTASMAEMKECEQPARTYARRSIVAARPLTAGTILNRDNIDFKRPGTGISPSQVTEVLGRALIHDLQADDLIRWEDLT